MGGRPWTSKGCWNCRKRKVKCDEKKPECERCIKRKEKCHGYSGSHQFVGGPVLKRPPRPDDLMVGVHPGAATRAQLFASFIHSSFPTETPTSYLDPWQFLITGIEALPRKTRMLEKAIFAMSCIFVGKVNHDDRVFHHGLGLYNSAIQNMCRMISKDAYSDDLIYTSVIFQEILPVYCPYGLDKWAAHVSGANAVIRKYRDKALWNPLMDAIYNQLEKVTIVLPSTGTSLSKVEYDHVMEPTNGNPLLELMQISADIGPIFSAMRSIDHSDPEACQALLLSCWGARERLHYWSNERHLGSSPLLECASAEFGNTDIPPTEALFGQAYLFVSQDDAVLRLTFWAQLVIVHKLIYHAHCLVRLHTNEYGLPSADLLGLGGEDILLSAQYASMIARGIPYCIQQSMRSSMMHMMAFILSTISTTFSDFQDRGRFDWLQQVFNHVAGSGFEYAARLAELARDTWAHQEQSGAEGSYSTSSLERFITQSHDEGSRNEEYLERRHLSFLT